jgi:glycosyltransferase involved in cell wall biosynthesis
MTDGTGQPLPTVSVIIPTYDDAERLSLCLRALQAQTYPAELIQVVVADNASTEDQRTALPPGDDRFVMVEESRRGSYAARNAAVAVATGEVLAFTDSDCLPHASWISSGVQALTATEPAPDAVGGAITLVFRHGPKPVTGPELYESLHGFEQRQYVEKHGFAATANLFVRASTFRAVGPFDASLRSGGDLNWGKRLTSSGRTLVYSPTTVIDHPSRPSWSELTTKSRRVAGGLADLAAVMPTRTVLARCARELRGGVAVWRRVWRMSPPDGAGAKVRYAAAYSYVSGLRSVVQLGRLVDRRTRAHIPG